MKAKFRIKNNKIDGYQIFRDEYEHFSIEKDEVEIKDFSLIEKYKNGELKYENNEINELNNEEKAVFNIEKRTEEIKKRLLLINGKIVALENIAREKITIYDEEIKQLRETWNNLIIELKQLI